MTEIDIPNRPDAYDFDEIDEMGRAHLAALSEVRERLYDAGLWEAVGHVDAMAIAYVAEQREDLDDDEPERHPECETRGLGIQWAATGVFTIDLPPVSGSCGAEVIDYVPADEA